MSEMAKTARREMRAKAERLGGKGTADPSKAIDASSWRPPPALDAGRKTGARPIRPRIYKIGGVVQGDRAANHPGKACRGGSFASGGKVGTGPLSMANIPEENKREFGSFHEGGYKRGGMPGAGHDMAGIKAASGQSLGMPRAEKIAPTKLEKPKAEKRVRMAPMKRMHKAAGGKVDPAAREKAGTYFGGTRPEKGGRMPHADGGKTLSSFAVHNLKSDKQMGESTRSDAASLMARKADKAAGLPGTPKGTHIVKPVFRANGGRAKGKTNINIVIAQPKQQQQPQMAMQGPTRPPMMPPIPPPQPQMPPPAGGPSGMPPGGPPPMMRKAGGRTGYPIDAGAAGATARLEQAKRAAKNYFRA